MTNRTEYVPLNQIYATDVHLRGVNQDDPEFKELKANIERRGLLNPIVVHETENGLELIDGLQRFTVLTLIKDPDDTVPVHIITLKGKDAEEREAEILNHQISGNIQRVETRKADLANQLQRILNLDPKKTVNDLARDIGKSPEYVYGLLNINKIEDEDVLEAINEGRINGTNAMALGRLAKVAPNEVANYIGDASTRKSDEFSAEVDARIKEIKAEARKGRKAAAAEFKLIPSIKKQKEVLAEIESGAKRKELIATNQPKGIEEAFVLALQWVTGTDPQSAAEQKANWEQRQADRAAKSGQKTAEAKEKKAKRHAMLAEFNELEASFAKADVLGPDDPEYIEPAERKKLLAEFKDKWGEIPGQKK